MIDFGAKYFGCLDEVIIFYMNIIFQGKKMDPKELTLY